MKRWIGVIGVVSLLGGIAFAQGARTMYRLILNGKPVAAQAIVVNGQKYVPVSALESAGFHASVTGDTLSLSQSDAAGGANQIGAVEGKTGDWLFNGIWRFRVVSVEKIAEGRPGWNVKVEMKNGTKSEYIALNNTGFRSITLVDVNGKELSASNNIDLRDAQPLLGGTASPTIVFYDDDNVITHPTKFILSLQMTPEEAKYMKNRMKVGYTVPDASFRVDLTPSAP